MKTIKNTIRPLVRENIITRNDYKKLKEYAEDPRKLFYEDFKNTENKKPYLKVIEADIIEHMMKAESVIIFRKEEDAERLTKLFQRYHLSHLPTLVRESNPQGILYATSTVQKRMDYNQSLYDIITSGNIRAIETMVRKRHINTITHARPTAVARNTCMSGGTVIFDEFERHPNYPLMTNLIETLLVDRKKVGVVIVLDYSERSLMYSEYLDDLIGDGAKIHQYKY